MTESLDIDIKWAARDWGSAAERATFGEVRIAVGDVVLTEAYDQHAMTIRDRARVSLLTLGSWFAENWWRLRWEPLGRSNDWRLSHHLAAAGEGFLWPPVMIASDGEFVSLQGESQAHSREPLRYVQSYDVSVPAQEFERAIDECLRLILDRLDACETPAPELGALWADVLAERGDSEMRALRQHEAMLGLDPDAVPFEEIVDLVASGQWMGEGALREVMTAAGYDGFGAAQSRLLDWNRNGAHSFDLASLYALRLPAEWVGEVQLQPWERGTTLAQTVRGHLGLGHEPIGAQTLCDLLQADVMSAPTTDFKDVRMSVGFREVSEPSRIRTIFTKPHPRSRRFEVARLMADAIIARTTDTVLPVTAKYTARQKTQRAFAQEFLCPIDAIRSNLSLPRPDETEITALADLYDVSEWTVISAAVNHKLVSRDYLDFMR